MSSLKIIIYNGKVVDFSLPSKDILSAKLVYDYVQPYIDTVNFGLFDKNGKFFPPESVIADEKTLFAYKGRHGNVFIYVNGVKHNKEPINFFNREFGYPYNHKLLNFAALERSLMTIFPLELIEDKTLSIETIKIDGYLHIYLSNKLHIESVYRMLGPLREINLRPTYKEKNYKGIGIIKAAIPTEQKDCDQSRFCARRISQIASTWKTLSKDIFSDLDYEIRNYKHFERLKKDFDPKRIEAYFIDKANLLQSAGRLPDPFFTDFDERGELSSLELAIANRPPLVKGRLEMYPTYFLWKSLNGKEKYRFNMNYRVRTLRESPMINDGDLAKMIVRYESMGAAGQFTMTPRSVIEYLVNNHGIKYEGFGAPFNVDLPFCSLMFDVDIPFGSMGPFSYEQLLRRSGNWSINPPFTLKMLELALESILKACERLPKEDQTQFHILFPGWEDDPWMDILTGVTYSEYLVGTIKMRLGEFSFERTNGKGLYAPFGGLIYSVFSPSGKKNTQIGEEQLLKIKEKFAETVPKAIKDRLINIKQLSWKELKQIKNIE